MNFDIGDLVTRKSYNNDVVFEVTDIIDDFYYLKGTDFRLCADSPEDDLVKYEWERIPHFYMNFYVYQYATGFAAAIKIANDIYNGNDNARDKYLEFLKLGCSKNPIDSLKVAGVDMTDSKVLSDSIKFMDELIKEYEGLIGSEIDE